ncbi:MAG: MerR family transcriptional regulator [Thermoleophilia bacterium]
MENLVPIGRFSGVCRLSVKALRHYDELGLLKPAWVDPDSGYRYYHLSQTRDAVAVRTMRSLDMPLDEIAALLADDDVARAVGRLERHGARLRERIAAHQRSLVLLERYIRGEENMMPYEVKLQEVQPQPIAALRYRIPPADISSVFGPALGQVFAHIGRAGGAPIGPPLAAYHTFDEDTVDFEVGIPIVAPIPEEPGSGGPSIPTVHNFELPGGLVATTIHIGSYDGLETAWAAIMGWIQEHGHEAGDLVCWETYLTDPESEPDPARWQTQLFVPLKA